MTSAVSVELAEWELPSSSARWTDTKVLSGFPQTAHFLAADPDKSIVIFRRFDTVSIRNLLFLEGRIAALENMQEELDREDKMKLSKDLDIEAIARSWEDFALLGTGSKAQKYHNEHGYYYREKAEPRKHIGREKRLKIPREVYRRWSAKRQLRYRKWLEGKGGPANSTSRPDENLDGRDPIRLRWKLALAIKDAVKEYQEAVILYSQMLSLKAPAKRSTEAVEDWFEGRVTNAKTKEKEEVGNGPQFYPDSAMSRLYQAGDRTGKGDGKMPIDLVSLHPPGDDDPLSKKISKSSWTFRLLKDQGMSDSQITYVPERKIHRWVTLFGLVAAILFLIAAIWVIWAIPERLFVVKLGVLTAFVVLFGVWVSYATTATRSEIFASTAAYAAVLVVYVGKG